MKHSRKFLGIQFFSGAFGLVGFSLGDWLDVQLMYKSNLAKYRLKRK